MNAFKQIIDFLKPDHEEVMLTKAGRGKGVSGDQKFKEGLDAVLLDEATMRAKQAHGHLTYAQLKKHGLQVSIELQKDALNPEAKSKKELAHSGGHISQLFVNKNGMASDAQFHAEVDEGENNPDSNNSSNKTATASPNAGADSKTVADKSTNPAAHVEAEQDEGENKPAPYNSNSKKTATASPNAGADSKTVSDKSTNPAAQFHAEADEGENNPDSNNSSHKTATASPNAGADSKTVADKGTNPAAQFHAEADEGENNPDSNNSSHKTATASPNAGADSNRIAEKGATPSVPSSDRLISSQDSDQTKKPENPAVSKSEKEKPDNIKSETPKASEQQQSRTTAKESGEQTKSNISTEIIKEAKKLREQSDSVEIRGNTQNNERLSERFSKESVTKSLDSQPNTPQRIGSGASTPSPSTGAMASSASEQLKAESEDVIANPDNIKSEKSDSNLESRILNNANVNAMRRDVTGRIAGIIQRQVSSNSNSGSWQHHRFTLEEGKSLNVSMKQTQGKIQLQLGTASTEIQKILQQHIQEIRAHLQEQFDIEIELELRQDAENEQNQPFAENLKKNELNNTDSVSTEQEANSSNSEGRVRSFGFNKNEWTG